MSPRFFSAFTLPDRVADHLAAHLPVPPPHVRPTPRHQWHVTVGYYGQTDPARKLTRLHTKVSGLQAPRLRIQGSGTFANVVLAKIATPDPHLLRILAEAADHHEGGYPEYIPHVTVGRWSRDHEPDTTVAAGLSGYRGPEWVPADLVLFASEDGEYTPVGRVPLLAASGSRAGC
ncbi:2'-5' RNA ligase family protein [Actinokineospora auranticolor]|uniref:2'-5' RNA ligase n=1 Tax=Actinokineospora auranticolor TaxID=155976 RepID=A0A2S6GQE1_9PSEU|nr:2'-5' RNA ligase family protein [Actinokineospora auranticolor]PPK67444.1 2'-5' RNA ligase [Actinokineospora auranticolor]